MSLHLQIKLHFQSHHRSDMKAFDARLDFYVTLNIAHSYFGRIKKSNAHFSLMSLAHPWTLDFFTSYYPVFRKTHACHDSLHRIHFGIRNFIGQLDLIVVSFLVQFCIISVLFICCVLSSWHSEFPQEILTSVLIDWFYLCQSNVRFNQQIFTHWRKDIQWYFS